MLSRRRAKAAGPRAASRSRYALDPAVIAAGKLPDKAPVVTSAANPHYQKRFDELHKLAAAGDWAAVHDYKDSRITLRPHDPGTGEEREVVKGYEYSRGQFLTFTAEELKALHVESSKVIDLEKFSPRNDIDPVYFDSSYYLHPDGPIAVETLRVIGAAMAEAGTTVAQRPVQSAAGRGLPRQRDRAKMRFIAGGRWRAVPRPSANGRKADAPLRAVETRHCEACDADFRPARSWSRFCGPACRLRACRA
jgi:hypothetical protein